MLSAPPADFFCLRPRLVSCPPFCMKMQLNRDQKSMMCNFRVEMPVPLRAEQQETPQVAPVIPVRRNPFRKTTSKFHASKESTSGHTGCGPQQPPQPQQQQQQQLPTASFSGTRTLILPGMHAVPMPNQNMQNHPPLHAYLHPFAFMYTAPLSSWHLPYAPVPVSRWDEWLAADGLSRLDYVNSSFPAVAIDAAPLQKLSPSSTSEQPFTLDSLDDSEEEEESTEEYGVGSVES
jgi:hypothetical protein